MEVYKECEICVVGLAMNDYYAGWNKRGHFWKLYLVNIKIKVFLPRLLLLPTFLAEFCASQRRTGEELYQEVERLMAEALTTAPQARLVLEWSMSAMQEKPVNKNHASCTIDGTLEDEEIFQDWYADLLKSTGVVAGQGAANGASLNNVQVLTDIAIGVDNSAGQAVGQAMNHHQ